MNRPDEPDINRFLTEEAFLETASASFFSLGFSCVCPPSGPCECGAVLE